jgi:hypothetical protein
MSATTKAKTTAMMKTTATIIHRRTFVERLGLGVGTLALAPFARSLIRDAHGQVARRRRVLILFDGNGWTHPECFVPANLGARKLDEAFETKDFAMHPSMAALSPYRDRMLVLDNVWNYQGPTLHSGHYKGYMPTTCMPHAGTAPGGPSIDQVIGRALLKNNPYVSVNFAARSQAGGLVHTIFAAGFGQGLPVMTSPEMALASLFAPVSGTQVGAALLAKRRRLLDVLNEDIKRMRTGLAGREKIKLDQFASALEDIGSRQQKLETLKACAAPMPTSVAGLEDNLAAHIDNAAAALMCGLTQVATIDGPGTGQSWNKLGISDTHALGHDGSAAGTANKNKIYNYWAQMIVRFAARLAMVPEGGGNMFDNTVVFWSNHNGGGHHSRGDRYPAVLIGNAGGGLKADGRFIRFPDRGKSGARSTAEVFCSLAHALDAPTDTFGKGGGEPVAGPVPQITA